MLGTVADVTVATGSVASLIINRTETLAATASDASASVSTSSLSLLKTGWQGVDLHNLRGQHFTGRVVVDDAMVLEAWLGSPTGNTATGCRPDALQFWQSQAASVSLELPFIEASFAQLNITQHFAEAEATVSLLWNGQFRFEFSFLMVEFQPVWSNPLWESLELAIDTEQQQVTDTAKQFAASLPTFHLSWGSLDAEALATIPKEVLVQGHARMLTRRCHLMYQQWLVTFASRGGMGLFSALTLMA